MQTRQATRSLLNKTQLMPSTQSSSVEKEDRWNQTNVTYQKVRSSISIYKKTQSFGRNRKKEAMGRIRTVVVNKFSKLQYLFGITMESLFLAIDLFDQYLHKNQQKLTQQINNIALTCFMLAVKYEQIYPPTFEQVQFKMKTQLNFQQFVALQFHLLEQFDYNLVVESPIKYLRGLHTVLDQDRKFFAYLYLEIAALTVRTCESWQDIMKAIKVLYMSRSDLEKQQIPEKITTILQKLLEQRSKLHENYPWLSKKYSDSRYHCMAYKPSSLGNGFQIFEATDEQ